MTAGGIGEGGRERDISISRKVGRRRRSRWRWFPPPSPFLLGGEERGGGVNGRRHPDIVQEVDIRRIFFHTAWKDEERAEEDVGEY